MYILQYIALFFLIIAIIILIKTRWVIPVRGFTQFTLFAVSEIAFFCNANVPCYNCPMSFGICPAGTMQRFTEIKGFTVYLTIILIGITGIFFGSLFCGWACPIGFLQDLINSSLNKKIKISNKFKWLRYISLLICIFVIFIELNYQFFSKQGLSIFHPYTIITGGLFLLISFVVKRPFCRFVCSIGLIYGKMNKKGLLKVYLDKKKCQGCLKCNKVCITDLKPLNEVNNDLCVKCFNCIKVCPEK